MDPVSRTLKQTVLKAIPKNVITKRDDYLFTLFSDFFYNPNALGGITGSDLSNAETLLSNIEKIAPFDESASIAQTLLVYIKTNLCGISVLTRFEKKEIFWGLQGKTKEALCAVNAITSNPEMVNELPSYVRLLDSSRKSLGPLEEVNKALLLRKALKNAPLEEERLKSRGVALKSAFTVIDALMPLCGSANIAKILSLFDKKVVQVIDPEKFKVSQFDQLTIHIKRLLTTLEEDLSSEQFNALKNCFNYNITAEQSKKITDTRNLVSKISALFSENSIGLKELRYINYELAQSFLELENLHKNVDSDLYRITNGLLGISNITAALKRATALACSYAYLNETPLEQFQEDIKAWYDHDAFIVAILSFFSKADFNVIPSEKNETPYLKEQKRCFDEFQNNNRAFCQNQYFVKVLSTIEGFNNPAAVRPNDFLKAVERSRQLRVAVLGLVREDFQLCGLDSIFAADKEKFSPADAWGFLYEALADAKNQRISRFFVSYDEDVSSKHSKVPSTKKRGKKQKKRNLNKTKRNNDREYAAKEKLRIQQESLKHVLNEMKEGCSEKEIAEVQDWVSRTQESWMQEYTLGSILKEVTADPFNENQEENVVFEWMKSLLPTSKSSQGSLSEEVIPDPFNENHEENNALEALLSHLSIDVGNTPETLPEKSYIEKESQSQELKAESVHRDPPKEPEAEQSVVSNKPESKREAKKRNESELTIEKKETHPTDASDRTISTPLDPKKKTSFTSRELKLRNFIRSLLGLGFYPHRATGDHQIMKNSKGQSLVVPLHSSLAIGTAKSIMKQATNS